MYRTRAILRVGVAAFAALLPASILQAGQPQLTIMRAEADQPPGLAAGKILIQGYNFVSGNETDVVVTLAGYSLAIIGTPTATEIVAELPAGYPPGTYLLTVSRGSGSVKNDSFDLTVGAAGPAGPRGEKGDKGDQGEKGLQGEPGPAGLPGPPGTDGKPGEKGEPGVPGLVARGPWLPAVGDYKQNDVVTDAGSTWRCSADTCAPGGAPSATNAQWELLAAKGDKGDPGDQGEQGNQGIPGPQGERGPQGEKGDTGERGIQGLPGPPGPPGAISSIDALAGLPCNVGTGAVAVSISSDGSIVLRCLASMPTCTEGTTSCSGQCVDLAFDNANCGTCGTTCLASQTCQNGLCVAQAAPTRVLVNEFTTGGAEGNDEFIELSNCGLSPAAIGGWQLVYQSAGGSSTLLATVPAGHILPPGAFYVIAGAGYDSERSGRPADQVYSGPGLAMFAGGIGLLDSFGSLVDSVGYGPSGSPSFTETNPAPAPFSGWADARVPNCTDTHDNSHDFLSVQTPTPGQANFVP